MSAVGLYVIFTPRRSFWVPMTCPTHICHLSWIWQILPFISSSLIARNHGSDLEVLGWSSAYHASSLDSGVILVQFPLKPGNAILIISDLILNTHATSSTFSWKCIACCLLWMFSCSLDLPQECAMLSTIWRMNYNKRQIDSNVTTDGCFVSNKRVRNQLPSRGPIISPFFDDSLNFNCVAFKVRGSYWNSFWFASHQASGFVIEVVAFQGQPRLRFSHLS